MKRVIALIMVALFCLTCIAYADDAARRQPAIEIYDFDGNRVENPDWDNLWQYGAVFDANGNRVPQTRGDYVNSEKILETGCYWRSYQYYISDGTVIKYGGSCSQSGISVIVEKAETIGGYRVADYGDLSQKLTAGGKYWQISSANIFVQGKELRYVDFMYVNDAPGTLTFKVHIST